MNWLIQYSSIFHLHVIYHMKSIISLMGTVGPAWKSIFDCSQHLSTSLSGWETHMSQWSYMPGRLWERVVIVVCLIENWAAGSQRRILFAARIENWVDRVTWGTLHYLNMEQQPCLCFHNQTVRSDCYQHCTSFFDRHSSLNLSFRKCSHCFIVRQFSTFQTTCTIAAVKGKHWVNTGKPLSCLTDRFNNLW